MVGTFGRIDRYQEVTLLSSAGLWHHSVTVTGKIAEHGPGYMPYIVRAFAVQNYTTIAYGGSPVITFWQNTSPGLTATGNYTSLDTVTLATGGSGDIGQVFYATPTSPTVIRPGQAVTAEVTTVTSDAHRVKCLMFIEPSSEIPSVNTNMTLSA